MLVIGSVSPNFFSHFVIVDNKFSDKLVTDSYQTCKDHSIGSGSLINLELMQMYQKQTYINWKCKTKLEQRQVKGPGFNARQNR